MWDKISLFPDQAAQTKWHSGTLPGFFLPHRGGGYRPAMGDGEHGWQPQQESCLGPAGWKRREQTLDSMDHLWRAPESLKLGALSSAWSDWLMASVTSAPVAGVWDKSQGCTIGPVHFHPPELSLAWQRVAFMVSD